MTTSALASDTHDVYEELKPLKKQIRLLTLHPPEAPEYRVTVSISTTSLSESHPPYEALSYVWGESTRGHTISLSGRPFPVTDNLFAALKQLRYPRSVRTIWIDALCINQENESERNSQVRLMEDIYTKCDKCWLWLGESAEGNGTHNAIQVLEDWASGRHLFSNANFNATYIRLAAELTSRPWFSRIWTVQESILPENITVQCGAHICSWDVFAKAAKNLEKHLTTCCISYNDTDIPEMSEVTKFVQAISTVERCRKLKLDILTCLNLYRNRHSTEAKDKIFGLLSLIVVEDQGLVEVDYGRKTEDTYAGLCEQHIKKTGSLEILKYVLGDAKLSKVGPALPSWVPDWTLDIAEPTWQQGRLDRYSLYKSCGSLGSEPKFIKSHEKYILRECGVRCGIVANIGIERGASYLKDEKVQQEMSERIPSGWSDSGLADLNREGREEKRFEFWSTILMDWVEGSDGNPRRAEKADYVEYQHVLEHVITGSAWPVGTDRIYYSLETATMFRKFFVTKDGHFGLGPPTMEKNDEIFVLRGSCCPLVLRSVNNNYKLIGDCFLNKFMDGEAMEEFESRSIIVSLE